MLRLGDTASGRVSFEGDRVPHIDRQAAKASAGLLRAVDTEVAVVQGHVFAMPPPMTDRAFGSWLSAVKKSVRSDMFLGFFTDLVPGTSAGVLHRPHELFSTLLDEWMSLSNDPLRYEIGREVLQHVYPRRV